jgi:hypothetical protein
MIDIQISYGMIEPVDWWETKYMRWKGFSSLFSKRSTPESNPIHSLESAIPIALIISLFFFFFFLSSQHLVVVIGWWYVMTRGVDDVQDESNKLLGCWVQYPVDAIRDLIGDFQYVTYFYSENPGNIEGTVIHCHDTKWSTAHFTEMTLGWKSIPKIIETKSTKRRSYEIEKKTL